MNRHRRQVTYGGEMQTTIVKEAEQPQSGERTMYLSTAGVYFAITPGCVDAITKLVAQVRSDIDEARRQKKFVAYLSVPVSPRGGGHFDTNNEIAAATAAHVEKRFARLKVINSAAYSLSVPGVNPGGGDYMAVWSDVLAGPDGAGNVFDLVYFVGPRDVHRYFRLPSEGMIDALEGWIDDRAANDPKFAAYIADVETRRRFVRYYAIRGSATYSKGSHDEWNLVVALNARRETGDDIAVYFDGEAVEPGDFDDTTDPGYQVV